MAKSRKEEEKELDDEVQRTSLRWMTVGIEFGVAIGFGCWIGYMLDQWADTEPGFLILGFLVAFGSMMYSMIKRAGGIKWK